MFNVLRSPGFKPGFLPMEIAISSEEDNDQDSSDLDAEDDFLVPDFMKNLEPSRKKFCKSPSPNFPPTPESSDKEICEIDDSDKDEGGQTFKVDKIPSKNKKKSTISGNKENDKGCCPVQN